MDAVSEVLIARSAGKDGLGSMLGASVMAHALLVALFVFLPAAWFGADEAQPENILQISLGGPMTGSGAFSLNAGDSQIYLSNASNLTGNLTLSSSGGAGLVAAIGSGTLGSGTINLTAGSTLGVAAVRSWREPLRSIVQDATSPPK